MPETEVPLVTAMRIGENAIDLLREIVDGKWWTVDAQLQERAKEIVDEKDRLASR